ncbi:MAG: heavy-metal-associated domain-containing protein [Rhodobiaceae bacterium]|nr:heavy-metal-associated domain-containing protein [Rhodobiaceae bacterium]
MSAPYICSSPDAGNQKCGRSRRYQCAGYAVPHQVVQLDIDTHCGNCASAVETALNAAAGVLSASINAASGIGAIEVAKASFRSAI